MMYNFSNVFCSGGPAAIVTRNCCRIFCPAATSCPAIHGTANTLVVHHSTTPSIMAPKGKGAEKGGASKGKAAEKGSAAKGKGKGKTDTEEKGGKVKGAQQINVRHILVRFLD